MATNSKYLRRRLTGAIGIALASLAVAAPSQAALPTTSSLTTTLQCSRAVVMSQAASSSALTPQQIQQLIDALRQCGVPIPQLPSGSTLPTPDQVLQMVRNVRTCLIQQGASYSGYMWIFDPVKRAQFISGVRSCLVIPTA